MNTRRPFLNTVMGRFVPTEQLMQPRIFGDILGETNSFRTVKFHKGDSILGDAQGAMLLLERVQYLARQGTVGASCILRAGKTRTKIIDVCNELKDMSLDAFDAKQRLAEIETNRNHCAADYTPWTQSNKFNVNDITGKTLISWVLHEGKYGIVLR
jgi:hypothetical protein